MRRPPPSPCIPTLSFVGILGLSTIGPCQAVAFPHPDGTTHWYEAVAAPTGIDWQQAHLAAAAAGGYLATINSAAENAFVFSKISANSFWKFSGGWMGPWVGGVQPSGSTEPAGGWAWGELESFSYTSWRSGKPDNKNNANRLHYCGSGGPASTWADAPSTIKLRGYVVEFSGPTTKRTVGLLHHARGSSPGYTLFNPWESTLSFLVDSRGRAVCQWNSTYRSGMVAYLEPSGHLLRAGRIGNPVFTSGGRGGIIEQFDHQGILTWQFPYSSATHCQHHDVERIPNGNLLLIAWELIPRAQVLARGRDPQKLSSNLWPDKIVEIKPDATGGTVVWEWRAWDHLIQDFDSTKAFFGDVSKHPELIDINVIDANVPDWMHSNSIDYNPKLDQIMLSVRSFHEFWIIDHSTTTAEAAGHTGGRSGRGGDLLYRWGNPRTYRAGTTADQKLWLQHDARWIEDGYPGAGHIMVLNNGRGRPGGDYSSVEEIVPPQIDSRGNYQRTGAAWGPANAIWQYVANPPSSFYSAFVAGAERQKSGNTVICEGWVGRTFEVDPLGSTVWEYENPIAANGPHKQGDVPKGAVDPNTNTTFRTPRYELDYPGIQALLAGARSSLEIHESVLLADGSTTPYPAKPGTSIAMDLRAKGEAGKAYLMITSATPGLIPVDFRVMRLGIDPLFWITVRRQIPGVFQNTIGFLDTSGRARATMNIPNTTAFVGIEMHSAFGVADTAAPNGVSFLSNTVVVEIVP